MCELLGVSALMPVTLEMSLQALMDRSGLGNLDGWGAVFYEKNDAYVFREPAPANDSALAGLISRCGVASQLMISHIRHATTGDIELRNTHPFCREIQGRLHSFAFNGNVPEVFDLDLSLERVSPIGDTDAEYAFCLLLELLALHFVDGDWRRTAKIIHDFGHRLALMGPANFLYSDSLRLFAFASRRQQGSEVRPPGLFYHQRSCAAGQSPASWTGLSIPPSASPQMLVLIASVPLSNEAWIPFEDEQLLVVQQGKILSTT